MSQVFEFAVIGLGAGSLYAIAAIGLVLVYRGSKVVNFAQGAMGMMAAYVFYELHQNWHQSVVIAIPAGLVVSGALGAAFYFVEIRQLKQASNLIKIVATLALFVIAQEVIALVFGTQPRIVNSSLPTSSVTILGASVGEDRLWIFGIVIVLTVVLWAVYKYTTFGLATTAVAENPTAAATLAISPDLVAGVNWAVGAALGGLAAILLVPITTLSAANLSLIVIPIVAAAVIGGFSSFPITTLAGLAMGVAQSEVTRYVSTPGWDTAVPFIAVTLILYFRGRRVAGRDEFFGKLPSVGSGRVPPVLVFVGVGITLLLIWVIFPYDWLVALEYQMIFALIITSLVVVTGYAGQISLAQMALAGIGALIAAWLYSSYHVPFELALVAGVIAVVPVGVVIALAGVRTRGVALAIVTLGLAFSLEAIIFTNEQFTGGVNGFDTDNPHFLGIAVGGLEFPARYATLTLGALVLVGLAVANLRRGRAGRRLIAVRTNERAAAAMGISVSGAKIYAFVLGAMIAALGGVLLVFFFPASDFTSFIGLTSVTFAESAVLGGVGHLGGPLVASSYQPDSLLTQVFSFLGGNVATWLAIAGAALLLVLLPTIPDGLVASLERQNAKWLGPLRARLSRRAAPAAAAALAEPCARPAGASARARPARRGGHLRRDESARRPQPRGQERRGARPHRAQRGGQDDGHRRHHGLRPSERRSDPPGRGRHQRVEPRAPRPLRGWCARSSRSSSSTTSPSLRTCRRRATPGTGWPMPATWCTPAGATSALSPSRPSEPSGSRPASRPRPATSATPSAACWRWRERSPSGAPSCSSTSRRRVSATPTPWPFRGPSGAGPRTTA